MMPASGWRLATVGKRRILLVTALCPYQVVKVYQRLSIIIILTNGAICYIRHDTGRGRTVPIRTHRLTVRPALCSAWDLRSATSACSQKNLETEDAVVVACGCNSYLTKADAVRKTAMIHRTKKVKAGKQIPKLVQYPASSDKTTKEVVETAAIKTDRKKPLNHITMSWHSQKLAWYRFSRTIIINSRFHWTELVAIASSSICIRHCRGSKTHSSRCFGPQFAGQYPPTRRAVHLRCI